MNAATQPAPPQRGLLVGREHEREVLDQLLDGARQGQGGVLVVHGQAGVGKTALLDYACAGAHEFRIARASGVEAEMELPSAAVHQVCAPFLELIPRLHQPQAEALGVAFGLTPGSAPNPFLVGLAVLGLLSEAAEDQPLLGVLDDAHWLDRSSAAALAFVARRVLAERIVLLFATREVEDSLAGLPSLRVEPLRPCASRVLLKSVLPAGLDESVLERIVAETHGNPLALMELPRGLTPTQLAGGFGLPAAGSLSATIEESFRRRLDELPGETRLLLLLAAAEPAGDPALLCRAAETLGLQAQAAADSAGDGLFTIGQRVTFRHPLVRSAVYGSASAAQRRIVHLALADATDRVTDPDRRAWHLSTAALAPDEEVACELERSAGRAQARGGLAAAAAFLQRSVALTQDSARRTERALAAAHASLYAGAFEEVLRLLLIAEERVPDERQRAHAALMRGQVAFASMRGREAPALLLDAARALEVVDPELAHATHLEALSAAMFAGHLAVPGAGVVEVARAARARPHRSGPRRAPDLLLDGLATLFTDGYSSAVPTLRQAQCGFGLDMSEAEQLHWFWLASVSCNLLWDEVRWASLSGRHVRLARATGALAELPLALTMRVYTHLFTGELTTAASLVEELRAVTDATGSHLAPYGAVGLAALCGREAEAVALLSGGRLDATDRGEGVGLAVLNWAEALLHNGLARYAEAYAAAVRVAEHPDVLASSNWWMVELIEAAVRVGTPELAADSHARLQEMADAAGTEWARGIEARSRALLTDGAAAEPMYREAIQRLGRTVLRPDLARAHLLYGEWLRRQRRRLDARAELRLAHKMFTGMGMEAFAERTRVELEATGARARRRVADTIDQLTPQEAQVARRAAHGETNRDIAAQLFISPSTVEYHLRKAFRKLGVRSRTQLAQRVL